MIAFAPLTVHLIQDGALPTARLFELLPNDCLATSLNYSISHKQTLIPEIGITHPFPIDLKITYGFFTSASILWFCGLKSKKKKKGKGGQKGVKSALDSILKKVSLVIPMKDIPSTFQFYSYSPHLD